MSAGLTSGSPDAPLLLASRQGAVATLTLNRPAKLNALLPESFDALAAHLNVLAEDETVSCLIITGAGNSFSAGHDLRALRRPRDAEDAHHEAAAIDQLEAFPHPTIAKIRGNCLTGGLELALACDILVAADDARLGDTHGKWGLVPIWGMSVRLPERIGPSAARELSYTSRLIDGKTAASIGLVDHSIAGAALDDEVSHLCEEIVANSRDSNRMLKALTAHHRDAARRDALAFERSMPFGLPRDMKERLVAPRRPDPSPAIE